METADEDPAGEWLSPSRPSALRGLIRSRHAYRIAVPACERHVALPQPGVTLIFSLGPDHHILDLRSEREVVVDSFLAGLTERASLVGGEAFVGIQIGLTPVGARRLLGGAVADLADQSVHVGEVLGRDALELGDRPLMARGGGWANASTVRTCRRAVG